MEIAFGVIGLLVAAIVPFYIQRQNHPKRELRYAVVLVKNKNTNFSQTGSVVKLRVWATGRADIPSALFDDHQPIIFRFSAPVTVLEQDLGPGIASSRVPKFRTPQLLYIEPQLIHQDFSISLILEPQAPFSLTIENPLVDVLIRRDIKVEGLAPARQEREVQRSKAKAHITLMSVAIWIMIATFALFVVGISVSFVDSDTGAAFGVPSILLFPVGVVLLLVAVVRRFLSKRRKKRELVLVRH